MKVWSFGFWGLFGVWSLVFGVLVEGREVFVADSAHRSAIVELRDEVTVRGAEVRLRQVARWSEGDAGVLGPVADLVVMRLSDGVGFTSISLDEVRRTLGEAGVNLGQVHFAGAMRCTISRADAEFDESAALEAWAAARRENSSEVQRSTLNAERSQELVHGTSNVQRSTSNVQQQDGRVNSFRTLREVLRDDLATRAGVAAELLHITFNPIDEKLLNLPEPHFRFHVEPRRGRGLGEVSWEVLIISGEQTQKANIAATARAWQEQVVLVRPLAARQLIQAEDVELRRVLSDRSDEETLLKRDQVVGQQAARDLKPGTVMTARLVDATPLVRPGQLVTIAVRQGGVQVKTVARAMEGGVLGQMIRVRNETTRDTFEVMLTGPQTAAMGE
jgi:flagella basal body P-ring formation protein FlgA